MARSWGREGGFRPSRAPRSVPCAPGKSIQTRAELQHGSNLQNAETNQLYFSIETVEYPSTQPARLLTAASPLPLPL